MGNKKVLITGVPGFAASHLAMLLLEDSEIELHGTTRVRSDMYRLQKMGIQNDIIYHLIELTDATSVYNVIKEVVPDEIYHLAAQDFVKASWDSPHETFNTNVNGTINLFMAIRQCYPIGEQGFTKKYIENPKVLITSTSETYGYHAEKIFEQTPQHPTNPYGVSKLTQDQLARLYGKAYDIPVVITRSFNVTGWGRNDPFVDSNFAHQIALIEKGVNIPIVRHGNLSAKRTFFDVSDAIRGYKLAMEYKSDEPEIFCFGADSSTSIQELLEMLIDLANIPIKMKEDSDRFRPIDTPDMRVDYTRAERLLGWHPETTLKESLSDLLNYWRERIN